MCLFNCHGQRPDSPCCELTRWGQYCCQVSFFVVLDLTLIFVVSMDFLSHLARPGTGFWLAIDILACTVDLFVFCFLAHIPREVVTRIRSKFYSQQEYKPVPPETIETKTVDVQLSTV